MRNLGALTEAECAALRRKSVLVAGCGGLGGHIIENLLRIGVGTIRAVDGDVFEPSNLNRQLLSETELLGTSKAEAAYLRGQRVNPSVEVVPYKLFLDGGNAAGLIRGCDAVIDALDNIPSRLMLARECAAQGIPYVFGAIAGWVAQAGISAPGDGLVEMLYGSGAAAKDKSVLAFTPALCAAMQCALCVRLLCGREVRTGRLYYADLLNMEFEELF